MSQTVPLVEDHLAGIKTVISDGTNNQFTVDVGEAPDGETTPYVVIYPGEGVTDGPVADVHADLDLPFQCTCVAADALEAAWLQDRVTVLLVNGTYAIPDRAVVRIRYTTGPVRREAGTGRPLFFATPLFTLTTTPA
jgi:hypothetical protein